MADAAARFQEMCGIVQTRIKFLRSLDREERIAGEQIRRHPVTNRSKRALRPYPVNAMEFLRNSHSRPFAICNAGPTKKQIAGYGSRPS
jgi:hypothetical protein